MKLIIAAISLVCLSFAPDPSGGENDLPAYNVFTINGKQSGYSKMLREVSKADIVLVGELHNNPIAHWMELQLTRSLYTLKKNKLVLGAEMFEADNQLIMNEYLEGVISEKNFLNEMRLWDNYETDYSGVVEFAKNNGLSFIATNVPRRYASVVYKSGFAGLDSLDNSAKNYLATLPIVYDAEIGCYKRMKEMSGGHGGDNLPKAQALKDATMAHFILKNRKEGQTFLHINGAYHSDNHEGIAWYLKQANPELKIITISTVLQNDVRALNDVNLNKADFILCVNSDITATY